MIGALVCMLAALLVAFPIALAWLGVIDRDMDERGVRRVATRHPLPRADLRRVLARRR